MIKNLDLKMAKLLGISEEKYLEMKWTQLNLLNPEKFPNKEEFIKRWTSKDKEK